VCGIHTRCTQPRCKWNAVTTPIRALEHLWRGCVEERMRGAGRGPMGRARVCGVGGCVACANTATCHEIAKVSFSSVQHERNEASQRASRGLQRQLWGRPCSGTGCHTCGTCNAMVLWSSEPPDPPQTGLAQRAPRCVLLASSF
jgi:hypothetical protein